MIATNALLTSELAVEVLAQLGRLVNDQFRDIRSAGPSMYAEVVEAQPGDMERRHAQGSVTALGQALRDRDIEPSG